MIYFLQSVDGGPIKIGTTVTFSARLVAHQAQKATKFNVLGVMDGGRAFEKELHERFAHLRIKQNRRLEWFHPAEELLAFIAEKASKWDGVDEVAVSKQKVVAKLTACEDRADAYAAWLREFGAFYGASPQEIMHRALSDFAHRAGFRRAPGRRRKVPRIGA